MTNLSTKGIQAIINWETGGESYYKIQPIWPGAESGVTIGIGWDLGHTSVTDTSRAWSPHLNAATLALLVSVSGRKGEAASEVLPHVKHLVIPWESALSVFENVTLPVWYMRTLRIYPQVVELHGDCAAALVGLVFNRGTSLSGDRRVEMAEIQRLLRNGDLQEIPEQIRKMKRLWPDLQGLRNRREKEADLFESGLVPAGE